MKPAEAYALALGATSLARSKYQAKPTTVDGIKFHSRKEAARYLILKAKRDTGAILDLELQPRFDFTHNGVKLGFYKADFAYTDLLTGERIVEDVKGMKTPMYRLKAKMLLAFHGIEILET